MSDGMLSVFYGNYRAIFVSRCVHSHAVMSATGDSDRCGTANDLTIYEETFRRKTLLPDVQ